MDCQHGNLFAAAEVDQGTFLPTGEYQLFCRECLERVKLGCGCHCVVPGLGWMKCSAHREETA